jgi:menaquinone-9 beta-reductase
MYDVIVIGGGLSGLVNAFLLRSAGFKVLVIEKKSYPFHRVCGEYISNEVIPFMEKYHIFPHEYKPPRISRFRLTSIKGNSIEMPLDLGGFGISRYCLDHFLYRKCVNFGVDFLLDSAVEKVDFIQKKFIVSEKSGNRFQSDVVIGAYGKRSHLDRTLNRSFMQQKSPYVGVKYHIKIEHPDDEIALHNFPGGYCGISKVENGVTNLCYLGKRSYLRQYGSIEKMEKEVIFQNPHLKRIFNEAEFIFDKPLVINEISFATKTPVEDHILMSGDSAGMVTPLCGNGMAIAIRSANILSKIVVMYLSGQIDRSQMEASYSEAWRDNFRNRLWTGRKIQTFFGKYNVSDFLVSTAKISTGFSNFLMAKTHGQPFA